MTSAPKRFPLARARRRRQDGRRHARGMARRRHAGSGRRGSRPAPLGRARAPLRRARRSRSTRRARRPTRRPLVLAIKPQLLDEAAAAVNALLGPRTLLVSVLAGKTIGDLRRGCRGATAIVRAMPNLPASIGRGATGAAAMPRGHARPSGRWPMRSCAASALVEWLASEDLIDAVTAVSGSGPAYVFHLVECLAEAGVAAGLPADLAGAARPRDRDRRRRASGAQRTCPRDACGRTSPRRAARRPPPSRC